MIGIMGGTFDPIHHGHLRTALEIAQGCDLEQVLFIPGHTPPHRPQPQASAEQRWRMVELAIANEPLFKADRRELERAGYSYTVDTLGSLRVELGDKEPLAFILGMDAFLAFRAWHRWEDIMQMTHLVVMHRPGYEPDVSDWYGICHAHNSCDLHSLPSGKVCFQAVTQLDISATAIREACKRGKSIRYLLPEQVRDYVVQQGLYL